jgi:hypothetical protein
MSTLATMVCVQTIHVIYTHTYTQCMQNVMNTHTHTHTHTHTPPILVRKEVLTVFLHVDDNLKHSVLVAMGYSPRLTTTNTELNFLGLPSLKDCKLQQALGVCVCVRVICNELNM